MSEAINHYQTYLASAVANPKVNTTGLENKVWAILMTIDRMMDMERKQIESNWNSHIRLDERLKRLEAVNRGESA